MNPVVAHYHSLETPSARFTTARNDQAALEIACPRATARIYVQGAHLCDWSPKGHEPVLFVSRQSCFAPGKAIRGGVPVCFPWFAARAGHLGSPAHGVLRTAMWKVNAISDEPGGAVVVEFSAEDDETSRSLWPHRFRAIYKLRVSDTLELNLTVENTGAAPFDFEEALHTYFRVADVRSATVSGLEHTEYLDKVDAGARKRLGADRLGFTGETDCVFVNTASTCVLHDPGVSRRISISKRGSATTVVWNPWTKKAAAMADFADDEWTGMLCIETANAGENAVTLREGQIHEMTATISVSPE